MDPLSARGARVALAGPAACAVVFAASAIAATAHGHSPTTYAGTSAVLRAIDLAAGMGLLVAGLVACSDRRSRRIGVLALLISTAWFAPDLDGWVGGPALLRSFGTPVSLFLVVLVLDMALTFGRPGPRRRLLAVALFVLYALAALAAVGLAGFRDPLLDVYCWRNCNVNALLVHADPRLARAMADVWLWITVTVGSAATTVCLIRLSAATAAARGLIAPVLAPAAVASAATAANAVALILTPLEDPTRGEFAALFSARAVAFSALAVGILWTAVRSLRTRARVSSLAADLANAPAPGRLGEALAAALGDPTLEVVYPVAGELVDANGKRRPPPAATRGRAITRISRSGRVIALVVHDAALVDAPELEREIGAAARLAAENEALRAEALARLEDLRRARVQTVATGDEARRRLERDLHDGAQQQLVAVLYDLARAHMSAEEQGDGTAPLIATAAARVEAGFAALRELVQGIYPLVLTDAGLAPALATLADSTAIPLELGAIPSRRFADAVEIGAYVTVTEGIRDAATRGATFVRADVLDAGDDLVVTINDDGAPRRRSLPHVADRVGALGGSLEVSPNDLRVELPCA